MMTTSTMDIKQMYRSVYLLVKQLDERKSSIQNVADIFSPDINRIRDDLIVQSETLIFLNHDGIGKRAREIFWRKGFYDMISVAKRLWSQDKSDQKMSEFLLDAISKFKAIVVKLESDYELNLRYIIDFSLLDRSDSVAVRRNFDLPTTATENTKFSWETINYALETVHAMLLSIGDLHRYFIDFKFPSPAINQDYAAKFYYEAFKLNPSIGMAQNQLGTLYTGQNNDLDSMYFYLYSLSCPQPFELSENNVLKIFQNNSDYLETLESEKFDLNLKDFMAQLILIVDIFFYDKDVTDFNILCHCTLANMRELLKFKTISIANEFWFKIVATFYFCMIKLKSSGSTKRYNLNAFLVAICSELIESCIWNLEAFIADRSEQNKQFQDKYNQLFEKFDEDVRKSREKYRNISIKQKDGDEEKPKKLTPIALDPKDDQKSQISELSSGKSVATAAESQNSNHEKETNGGNVDETCANANSLSPANQLIKNKKGNVKMRRRRKKISSYESNSDLSSQDESDIEMDSDFSSDEMSCDSSFASTDNDYDDDDDDSDYANMNGEKDSTVPTSVAVLTEYNNSDGHPNFSDNDDIVIEEEKIVYENGTDDEKCTPTAPNDDLCTYYLDPTAELIKNLTNIELTSLDFCFTDDDKDLIVEEETIVYTPPPQNGGSSLENIQQHSSEINGNALSSDDNVPENQSTEIRNKNQTDDTQKLSKIEKLRYKRKYSKIDPNIIIEFAAKEKTLMALKILFDWLKINNDILMNCFLTNPEFVHKIMKLLNYFNIDIFTNKVYFERDMLVQENVRENLRSLFDIINIIPLSEDILLKKFPELQNVQQSIDWEVTLKSSITDAEENILRIFKLVDFGFFMCKMKKFKYNFCAKTRRFTENVNLKKERGKGGGGKRTAGGGGGQKRRDKRRQFIKRKGELDSRGKQEIGIDDNDIPNDGNKNYLPKKGYLKNRNLHLTTDASKLQQNSSEDKDHSSSTTENKYEIMGKLWLRNEVQTLESKMKRTPATLLTPYLVMDSKSLTEYTAIVKNLLKTKKFIVLIPNAVFSELDELKKTSERARNAIRWLEKEFSKGSRFLRPQRKHESLPLALLKLPKKLDREALTFLKIAEFCNYIQKHSNGDDQSTNSQDSSTDILTLLTGDPLTTRKSVGFSYIGIMNAMSVNFEQITAFYGKYKKK